MPKTRRIKLVIAYEGTNYKGWQRQPDAVTVQGTIEAALTDIIGPSVQIRGASRTDAGVHAQHQVATFDTDSPIPDQAFEKVLNGRLPADIVIRSASRVTDDFDASRAPICKTYHYRIHTAHQREVVHFRRRWHLGRTLDLIAVNDAAGYLLGTHDYAAFASAKDDRDNTVRTVLTAHADRTDDEVTVIITADRFLYNMVRNIVGTLVEIGRGHWTPDRLSAIFAGRDRTQAGPTAPPEGLCLMHIEYDKKFASALDTEPPADNT